MVSAGGATVVGGAVVTGAAVVGGSGWGAGAVVGGRGMTFRATGRFAVRFLVAASAEGTAIRPNTTVAATPACTTRIRERNLGWTGVIMASTVCERTIRGQPRQGRKCRNGRIAKLVECTGQPMTRVSSPDFFKPLEMPVMVNG